MFGRLKTSVLMANVKMLLCCGIWGLFLVNKQCGCFGFVFTLFFFCLLMGDSLFCWTLSGLFYVSVIP